MKSVVLWQGALFSLLQIECSSAEDLRRPKRIIGGAAIVKTEYPPPFQVLKYYIWYGYPNLCYQSIPSWNLWAKFRMWIRGIGCGERPENLIGGGALITPKIVQTACHCLSYPVFSATSTLWSKGVKMAEFENTFIVYIGEVDVKNFNYGVQMERFVIHQNCGKLKLPPQYYRYDVGWIILEKAIDNTPGIEGTHWGPVEIAGPFKYDEIVAHHSRVVTQRHVCLISGFGNYRDKGKEKNSPYFRYGWIQVIDDVHCEDATWRSYGHQALLNYKQSRTFACAVPLQSWNNQGGKHGVGDSGSPITCNEHYFAVLSSEIYHRKRVRAGIEYIMFEMPIRYTLEANAVEFRRSFELDMLDLNEHRLHSRTPFETAIVTTPDPELRKFSQARATSYTPVPRHANGHISKISIIRQRESTTAKNTGHLKSLFSCFYTTIVFGQRLN